jgi:hypothetical protein
MVMGYPPHLGGMMPPMGAPQGYMAGPYGGYPPPMVYPPMPGMPLGYPYAPQMGYFPVVTMPHQEGVHPGAYPFPPQQMMPQLMPQQGQPPRAPEQHQHQPPQH